MEICRGWDGGGDERKARAQIVDMAVVGVRGEREEGGRAMVCRWPMAGGTC